MDEPQDRHPFLLSTEAPGRRQRRLAASVLGALVAALLLAAPFAHLRPPGTEILLPAYAASASLVELLTAALLFAIFSIDRSRPLLILSMGFLFSGLLVIPWALTFPGVFTGLGLEADMQVTPAIAALRRLGFPLFVLAYAFTRNREPARRRNRGSVGRVIAGRVLLVAAIVFGLVGLIVLRADDLPVFMRDARDVTALWHYVPAAAAALYVAGLASLWARLRSTLDLWLMVVLCTLLIEIVLISYLGGAARLSVGWWAGRLYGLVSGSLVLVVLLSETASLQARLARSVRSERLAREGRLTAMEALSALIAHEINQPLSSMVTNAGAGLRWLDNDPPRIHEARSALERVMRDGHRARDVVDGIRKLFKKEGQERVPLDLNRLIDRVLRRIADETRFGRVQMEADLHENALPVVANPTQMEQVVSNLVANAIDALSAIKDRPRVVRIRSCPGQGEALVSVADTGSGILPEVKDRMFDPFYSTKPEGMGMGLMLSRSIVEDHGGRLWATENRPHGAIFHFTLPCRTGPGSSGQEPAR